MSASPDATQTTPEKLMQTLHELAVGFYQIRRSLYINTWIEEHQKCPDFIARKILVSLRKKHKREAFQRSLLEFPRQGRGGRTKDYVAEITPYFTGLRRVSGLKGQELRALVTCMQHRRSGWGHDVSTVRPISDEALGGKVGEIRCTGVYVGHDGVEWTESWAKGFVSVNSDEDRGINSLILMALYEAIRLDLGKPIAEELVAQVKADPNKKIGGYLAETLSHWLEGRIDGRAGYERCSGGEYYTYLRTQCGRDVWETLLSRAPIGTRTETAIQVYPHEKAKEAACRAAGLFETFRMNDSIFSGSPEQVAMVA